MTHLYDLSSLPKIPSRIITRGGDKVDLDSVNVKASDSSTTKYFRFNQLENNYIRYAVKLFSSYMLQSYSLDHAKNFELHLIKWLSGIEKYQQADLLNSIQASLEEAIKELRGGKDEYSLWYLKYWYIWCESIGLPYFDSDFAISLENMKISGNEKGKAVLSLDRDIGPLSTEELSSLLYRLESYENVDKHFEKTLVYMYLTLGCNSSNITLLHWEDFQVLENGDTKIYFLNVPSIKKRTAKRREEFKKRELDSRLGRLIEAYKSQSVCDEIMFTKKKGCYFKDSVARAISEFCKKELSLNFHITPRRLRYTFATRLVMNGVSKEKLADLLDHSDLQHVQVYYDLRHKIKDFLSEAESKELGEVFKRFKGDILDDATNGDIKFPYLRSEDNPVVGKCGSESMCDLNPPYSCFVCDKFKAFSDSVDVYKKILAHLVKWSKLRKEEYGENDRIHSLMHDVQLALGDLIRRIENA